MPFEQEERRFRREMCRVVHSTVAEDDVGRLKAMLEEMRSRSTSLFFLVIQIEIAA